MICRDCIYLESEEDGGCPFIYCEENDIEAADASGECESFRRRPLYDD